MLIWTAECSILYTVWCTTSTYILGSHNSVSGRISLFIITAKISWDIESNPGPSVANLENVTSYISLCHLNARSLKAKFEGTNIMMELIRHDLSKTFNIITVSETWLSDSDDLNDFLINGFQRPFVLNRPTRAGGVLCWVRNNIAAKRRQDLETHQTEALWLEIRVGNNKFLLCTVYRPPSQADFYDHFQVCMDRVQQSDIPFHVIIGDLNSDPNTNLGRKLSNFATINNLSLHINVPTRITSSSSTILDQCMSNCPMFIRGAGVLPPLANNDHCTIHLKVLFKTDPSKCYKRLVWDFSAADNVGYRNFLQNFNFDTFFNGQYSVDEVSELVTNTILLAAKQFIPSKTVTIRPSDKSFYNSNLRHLKLKLDRLHKRAKITNSPDIWTRFRQDQNMYIREVKKAKCEFSKKKYNEINSQDISSKKFYSFIKTIFMLYTDTFTNQKILMNIIV